MQNKNPEYANALERAMNAARVLRDPAKKNSAKRKLLKTLLLKSQKVVLVTTIPSLKMQILLKKADIRELQRSAEQVGKEPRNRLREQKFKLVHGQTTRSYER